LQFGVLAAEDKEQLNWVQWVPPEGGSAEIPLNSDQSERYPVGVALSISSQRKLQFGETISPVSFPILIALTSDGLLTGFYTVNHDPAAAQVLIAFTLSIVIIIRYFTQLGFSSNGYLLTSGGLCYDSLVAKP
jgi:hypothetical protein